MKIKIKIIITTRPSNQYQSIPHSTSSKSKRKKKRPNYEFFDLPVRCVWRKKEGTKKKNKTLRREKETLQGKMNNETKGRK